MHPSNLKNNGFHRNYNDRQISQYREQGFSLLELMCGIAVSAALIVIATPSFAALVSRAQVTAQANELLGSLSLARNEAFVRQKVVHLCQIANQASGCDNQYHANRSWSRGWIVFVDNNSNNEYDTTDTLLRSTKIKSAVRIVFNQRGRLRYFPDGSSRSAGFYLCDAEQTAYRHIYLLYSGRARINNSLNTAQRRICSNSAN